MKLKTPPSKSSTHSAAPVTRSQSQNGKRKLEFSFDSPPKSRRKKTKQTESGNNRTRNNSSRSTRLPDDKEKNSLDSPPEDLGKKTKKNQSGNNPISNNPLGSTRLLADKRKATAANDDKREATLVNDDKRIATAVNDDEGKATADKVDKLYENAVQYDITRSQLTSMKLSMSNQQLPETFVDDEHLQSTMVAMKRNVFWQLSNFVYIGRCLFKYFSYEPAPEEKVDVSQKLNPKSVFLPDFCICTYMYTDKEVPPNFRFLSSSDVTKRYNSYGKINGAIDIFRKLMTICNVMEPNAKEKKSPENGTEPKSKPKKKSSKNDMEPTAQPKKSSEKDTQPKAKAKKSSEDDTKPKAKLQQSSNGPPLLSYVTFGMYI